MDWIPRVAIVSAATAPAGRAPRTFRDETRKSRLFCHRLSESFLAREGERVEKMAKTKLAFTAKSELILSPTNAESALRVPSRVALMS